MSNTLSQLADSTSKGLRELSQHPIQYTSRATKELIEDYWDLGAAVLAGVAMTDFNSEHFGVYREPIILGGIIGAMIPSAFYPSESKSRFISPRPIRNLSAFFAGMCFSSVYNSPQNEETFSTLNKAFCYSPSVFWAMGSLWADKQRKK